MRQDEQVASVLDIFFEVVDLSGCEGVFGSGDHKEVCLFDFFELD